MMTRLLKGSENAVAMTLYVQLTFLVVCIAMGLAFGSGQFAAQTDPSLAFLFRAWVWPAPWDWPVMVISGLASAIGGLLIAQAYRLCEAGLAAPFEYGAVPLAILWGATIFGEWPDGTAWIGIALICGAGLFVFWREAVAARRT